MHVMPFHGGWRGYDLVDGGFLVANDVAVTGVEEHALSTGCRTPLFFRRVGGVLSFLQYKKVLSQRSDRGTDGLWPMGSRVSFARKVLGLIVGKNPYFLV